MKECISCKIQKPNCQFAYKNKAKNKLQNTCKECHKIYSKNHYLNNVEKYKKKAKKRNKKVRQENKVKYIEYLKSHPCVDCQESDILVLTFDHICEKKYNVSSMIGRFKWEDILEEIFKCEVRCANCHVRRHFKENGWRI